MDNPSLPQAPLSALSALAPELASTVASLAGDIALVIDDAGVVRNVAVGEAALSASTDAWVGRPWADTVTGDTRRKIEDLLTEVQRGGRSRRREVNHPSVAGSDIPVAWAAVRLGEQGPVLAVGRDLRAVAAIQQRFLESQQELERDYWKRRQTEARYRLLFQVATDAVLVLDAASQRVLEVNGAAARLFGQSADRLVGLDAPDMLSDVSRPALAQLLAQARLTGRAGEIRVRGEDGGPLDVSVTPFRADQSLLLMLRVRQAGPADALALLAEVVERGADAVVVSDTASRVVAANPAFLALCRQSAVEGQRLGELLGDTAHRLDTLIADVRRHGLAVRSVVPGSDDTTLEVSATLLPEGDQERIGFTLRVAEQRLPGALGSAADLANAIAHLTEQVGQRPLPQLMRQAAALAERHLIQSALQSHGPAVDAVATALGLDTRNLELRMQRLGMVPGSTGFPTVVD